MVVKGKKEGRAISVPWRYWKAELYSHITTSNIGPRLRQYSSALAKYVKYWRANAPKARYAAAIIYTHIWDL
jgi:hypothetical protein